MMTKGFGHFFGKWMRARSVYGRARGLVFKRSPAVIYSLVITQDFVNTASLALAATHLSLQQNAFVIAVLFLLVYW